MGLLGERAVRHGPGLEALDDLTYRLHFFNGHRCDLLPVKFQQTPQGVRRILVAGKAGVFLVFLVGAFLYRLLQGQNGHGVPQVLLRPVAGAQKVHTLAVGSRVDGKTHGVKAHVVPPDHRVGDLLHTDAAHAADGIAEIAVDHVLVDAHGLENLGAAVGLNGGDAHLGGDLHYPVQYRPVISVHGGVVVPVQKTHVDHLTDTFVHQIRADGRGAVAQQGGKVVYASGLSALQNHGHGGAFFRAHQILLQGGDRQ